MNKTIWIINDYAGSPYHGMPFRHYNIGIELKKKGYNIYIISATYSHLLKKYPSDKVHFNFENIDDLNYCWVRVPKYEKSFNIKRIIKWFVFNFKILLLPFIIKEKPSIIISSPTAPFTTFFAKIISLFNNAKLIHEVRDIWPLTIVELSNFKPTHPFVMFMQLFENFAYKTSDCTVSVLKNSFSHMQNHGLSKNKFNYIPNGILISDKKILKTTYDQFPEIPRDHFIVGYSGTIGIAQNLETLIRSALYIPRDLSISFLIIGSGSEYEKMLKLKEELKIRNIYFTGHIDKKYIPFVLEKMDVCYIGLRKKEIFKYGVSPNKLYEYMYAKKSLIYGINDFDNIVDESKCGITVNSENPEDIARGVIELYNKTSTELGKMGLTGFNYVNKHHSYNKIAKKYVTLFNKIHND